MAFNYTPTPTPSVTPTISLTPSNTPTNTPTSTSCPGTSPTNTPTNTETPTNTPTNTLTPTNTPTNTQTSTPTLTATPSLCVTSVTFQVDVAGDIIYTTCCGNPQLLFFNTGSQVIMDCLQIGSLSSFGGSGATISSITYGPTSCICIS